MTKEGNEIEEAFPTLPKVDNPDKLYECLRIEKPSPPEASGAFKPPTQKEPPQPPPLGLACDPPWIDVLKVNINMDREHARFRFIMPKISEEEFDRDRVIIETLRYKYPMRWATMGDSDDELDWDDYRQKPKPLHSRRSPWSKNDGKFEEPIKITIADLQLPKIEINLKGNRLKLEEGCYLPVAKGWGYSLLGICCGKFPGKDAIQRFAKALEFHTKVAFHNKGWIVFSFAKECEMIEIKRRGPYTILGTTLVMYDLPPEFRFDAAPNFNIEVWASLPRLPMELWNIPAINCIGHAVGSPLQVDPSSLARNHPNGPRFQVLINAMDEPFEEIEIEMHNGNWIKQKIVFEFLPRICSKCGMLGHSLKMCRENGDHGNPPQSSHTYKAAVENHGRGPPPWTGNRTQGPPPHRNGWVRNNYPPNENHTRAPPPRNDSRPRGPPPQNESRSRGPPPRGDSRPRGPPPQTNVREPSRGRSRMGWDTHRNRSKSAPKKNGKSPVKGRRSLSKKGTGRHQVWQEKIKETPTEPIKLNAHTRFDSPSSSASLSYLACADMPGDQAIRLHYSGETSNANMVENLNGDVEFYDESSSENCEMDFNIIIPDSLVEEGSDGLCAEEEPYTPTNCTTTTVPCEVPLSPSPISLSGNSTNISGKEKVAMDESAGQKPARELVNGQPMVNIPKAADSDTNRVTTTKENFIARNICAIQKPKGGSNKKGKRSHKKKSPRGKYGKK